MKRPDSVLEANLNKIKVYTLEEKSVSQDHSEGKVGAVIEVEVPTTMESAPDFGIKTISKRGVHFHFTDFKLIERESKKLLVFNAYTYGPTDLVKMSPVATTFVDMCWNCGLEPVHQDKPLDVSTPKNPEIPHGDIGWYIPSRLLDNMIDALGKINDTFLVGLLQEAIIYGPYYF